MKQRILKGLGVASLAVALATTATFAAPKPTFTPLGVPGAQVWGMSADGSKLVGLDGASGEYFYWTRAEGVVRIGGGGDAGRVVVSGNGNVIAGTIFDENGNGVSAKWLGGADWQPLESIPAAVPCDTSLSSAWGIDFFGQTLVGLGWLPQVCRAHGAVWDLVNGGPATDLGSLVEGSASRANAISGDGHVIVGWQDSSFGGRNGARWVDGAGEVILTPAGEYVGEVAATNYDGTAMSGDNYRYGSGTRYAWVWTAGKGFTQIDSGPIYVYNAVTSMSANGSVVGGVAREPSVGRPRGWIFRNGKFTWMTEQVIGKKKLAPGWIINAITAISADGRTIAGEGINPVTKFPEGFVIENF